MKYILPTILVCYMQCLMRAINFVIFCYFVNFYEIFLK